MRIRLFQGIVDNPLTISQKECKQIGEKTEVFYPKFLKTGDPITFKMYFGNTTIKIIVEFMNPENGEIARKEHPVEYSFL